MLLVIPVSCVMGGGILNRPGLISVAIGACVGSVTFTAAISDKNSSAVQFAWRVWCYRASRWGDMTSNKT